MTGTITKRAGKRGTTWRLRYDVGNDPITGKRRQAFATVKGGTRAEAGAELRRRQGLVDLGQHIPASKTTVAQWSLRWLADLETLETLGQRTIEVYGSTMRLHVLPEIGTVRLQALTKDAISAMLKSHRHKGLSSQSTRNVRAVLSSCLAAAKDAGLVAVNAAQDARAPGKRATSRARAVVGLDRDQLPALLDAFHGHRLHALVALAVGTGLRRGELLGLTWQGVDLDRGTIAVMQQVEHSRQEGVRLKQGGKTSASERKIGLDPALVGLLRSRKVTGKGTLARAALLFPHPGDDRAPMDPESASKAFRRVADRAGFVGLRLHDLRHLHASRLLSDGVPVHSVAARLGHSSPTVTLQVYSHVLRQAEERAVEAAGSMMREALRL